MTGSPLILKPKLDAHEQAQGLFRERTALDLSRYEFRRTVRGWVVHGTWLRIDPRGPCLALTPARGKMGRVPPFVVPLNDAWIWDETIGDPIESMLRCSLAVDQAGGNPFDVKQRNAVLHAIRDHLGDLIHMQPEPPADSVEVAVVRLRDTEGNEIHREARDAL